MPFYGMGIINFPLKSYSIRVAIMAFCAIGMMAGFVIFHDTKKDLSDETYVPSEEFFPAYCALSKETASEESIGDTDLGRYVDLEETIRVLNSWELAQSSSMDYMEFLEALATMDYRHVDSRVLAVQRKLLPVLQTMKELDDVNESLEDSWSLFSSLTGQDLSEDSNIQDKVAGIVCAISNGVVSPSGYVSNVRHLFDRYESRTKLKSKTAREMREVKAKYLDYISGFSNLYYDFYDDWDRLCLMKDKAYIYLYENQPLRALEMAEKVLEQSEFNRDALLLASLSLVLLGESSDNVSSLTISSSEKKNSVEITNDFFKQALQHLDNYDFHYPSNSAPSLLIRGMIYLRSGYVPDGKVLLEQSAIEYPRQVASLSDVLDSYHCRSYLQKSAEGLNLETMFNSMAYGFGLFSPNLALASYYKKNDDLESCAEEIRRHFFRRFNQDVFDGLVSDIELCERYFPQELDSQRPSHGNISFSMSVPKMRMIMGKNDKIKLTIKNTSLTTLNNVRVLICLRMSEMYKDQHFLIHVPEVLAKISPEELFEFRPVSIDMDGKDYGDIINKQVFIISDNAVIWATNTCADENE